MQVFISMTQLFVVFYSITTMVSQTLGKPLTGTDEEETFVRELVAKMMNEDNHPVKTNKDALVDVSRRLSTLETKLVEIRSKLGFLDSEHSATISVEPFDCGGVIDYESDEVLEFEAPYSLPYASSCVWTIRLGNYYGINITLLEENFGTSMSKLRVFPLYNMLVNSYTGSSSSLNIQEWSSGSGGSSQTFVLPVVFVELVMQGNASTPPRFHLSFVAAGGPDVWDQATLASAHITKAKGTITQRNRNSNDIKSIVILPKSPYPRNVALIPGKMNMTNCTGCDCNFIRIWKIGSQKLLGNYEHKRRFCGQAPNFHEEVDNVGWIIVYNGYAKQTGDFSIDYHTNGIDD